MPTIYFGYDYGGAAQRDALLAELARYGEVIDVVGDEKDVTYVEAAHRVAKGVQHGKGSYGVVICGTGMGVSIVANKHKGVHAARCLSAADATDSKLVNNANVLCLSGRIAEADNIKTIEAFFTTHFDPNIPGKEYRTHRLAHIEEIEERHFGGE